MRLRIFPKRNLRKHLLAGLSSFYLLVGMVTANGSEVSGVLIRESIQQEHRNELVEKLRTISGLPDLLFNKSGLLERGPNQGHKGSAEARKLIEQSLSGPRLIILEDSSSRSDVAFCQVHETLPKFDRAIPNRVFVILIDFTDFQNVMGDKRALAAFDVGWAFLHELDHIIADSHDPHATLTSGECETHINNMRKELDLPIRMDYFFSSLPVNPDPRLVSRFVRLRFEQREPSRKTKRYWVIWDAAIVGGLPSDRLVSSR